MSKRTADECVADYGVPIAPISAAGLPNTISQKNKALFSDDYRRKKRHQTNIASVEKLFEVEAQASILDLARAATSTLIIHVYHRCFGKCNGYYRPSLFKTNEFECIECATCNRMLSPRRFVGHTHGSKETNTCHWGFDSYNWRQYIHLSRRQTLNNLDDDELIFQLKVLKSAQDDLILGTRNEDLNRIKQLQIGLTQELPSFVTIEGFRVASYMIDGEHYLCLPNLLQFIQQRYLIEKAVDIFEETVSTFISATPKQVEGFIKAGVLPPGAKSCPLVKRSESDRICLALFDQSSKSEVSKSNSLPQQISTKDTSDTKEISASRPSTKNPRNIARSDYKPSGHSDSSSINVESHRGPPIIVSGRNLQSIDTSHHFGTTKVVPAAALDAADKRIRVSSSNLNHKNVESASRGAGLFEVEAQEGILNLARAATSALIIHVYHRCFGKCNGYYRPSLFKTTESECIECASCHRTLSPRGFVGHTHGTKETNTCHWGFDSYKWRQYIHLSHRQTLNNLDADELIVRLQALKSARDELLNPS